MRASFFVGLFLCLLSLKIYGLDTENQKESTRMIAAPLFVLATKQVIGFNRKAVGFAFRLKPNNEDDTGWVFWSGSETQSYIDDTNNTVVAELQGFVESDPSLLHIINKPVGTAWERDSSGLNWVEVPDYFQ